MIPDYHCPVCGTISMLVVTPTQAFCTGGDDCEVVIFNPELPDGGLSNPHYIDLSPLDDPDQ